MEINSSHIRCKDSKKTRDERRETRVFCNFFCKISEFKEFRDMYHKFIKLPTFPLDGCRVSFSIPMRVEEGKALIQDFFSLVRWVSFSIPKRAEEGNALIRGVFLSCAGYRFRYLWVHGRGVPSFE